MFACCGKGYNLLGKMGLGLVNKEVIAMVTLRDGDLSRAIVTIAGGGERWVQSFDTHWGMFYQEGKRSWYVWVWLFGV